MENINEDEEKITLTIKNMAQDTIVFNDVDTKNILSIYINKFDKYIRKDYSQPYVLYNGSSIFNEELNKPLAEIINKQDKKEKKMSLIFDKNSYEEKVILTITNETQHTENYKVDNKEQLSLYIKKFAESIKANYSQLYVLYNGRSLFRENLNISIKEIMNMEDKNNKRMSILIYQVTEFDIEDQDDIIIVLSIESVKIEKLKGKRGEILRDTIINSSIIKLDLKWCNFKYGKNDIDLNQKFDDIANEEDKKNLKIELTVTFTIPLIVNFVKNKEKLKFQCLLGYRVDNTFSSYCRENHIEQEDCIFIYKNEKVLGKKFFELIFDNDETLNTFLNETINDNNNSIIGENLNQTNKNFIINEKINYNAINVPLKKKIDVKKLEIEIKVVKPCFFARYEGLICIMYILFWVLVIIGAFIFLVWKLFSAWKK